MSSDYEPVDPPDPYIPGAETPPAEDMPPAKNIPREEKKLDPEEAKKLAIEFATTEDEIVELIRKTEIDSIGIEEIKPGIWVNKTDSALSLSLYKTKLQGFGTGNITFAHRLFGEPPYSLDRQFDVRTRNRLDIGLYTEDDKQEEIKEEFSKDVRSKNTIQSVYYFDKEGRYGKVSSLPRNVSDSRPDLGGSFFKQKYVVSEMTSRDFELVGFALAAAKKTIQPAE